jgi:hypothetical protein
MASDSLRIDPMKTTTRAEDLRIGHPHEISGGKEPETIKELHELCISRRTPHVHVVTNKTSACYGFRQFV